MQFSLKLAAWTAVAALGAAGLFAAETTPNQHARGQHRLDRFMTNLNLSDAQRTQVKSIFQEARQSAMPIRQQLRETRKSLHAAIKADNVAQIQQFATTEGSEFGQLAAIRSTASAKVYQKLTPDQKTKLEAMAQARHERHQRPSPTATN